ncbi:MAG TPA: DUF1493 family protein [Flavobacteriaceae bacterium]|nr:DUF1493 family protein [Flavobacteriaceae bacterium]MCB9212257.1 DUF1493 family protein [Alteromonas sp.]HPF10364.1 DUF1493 family protein [Flavobacteriaceae bacterium]HQU20428.1 DUF1493 family protein [Flavobacteriaceae bacterium]HQU65766.1 DUF1493 family protein [Flavobacteriaceae bacterium]
MDTFDQIIDLLPKKFLKKIHSLNRETELEENIGLTGDDADEFLSDYAEKFNVDISEFIFNDYFLEEGEDHFQTIASWFFGQKIKKNGRKRLTLGHLEDAVRKGKLV